MGGGSQLPRAGNSAESVFRVPLKHFLVKKPSLEHPEQLRRPKARSEPLAHVSDGAGGTPAPSATSAHPASGDISERATVPPQCPGPGGLRGGADPRTRPRWVPRVSPGIPRRDAFPGGHAPARSPGFRLHFLSLHAPPPGTQAPLSPPVPRCLPRAAGH